MTPDERATASKLITAAVMARARAVAPPIVAAYIPFGAEPGSTALLDELSLRSTVIVPVPRPDGGLDWAAWTGADDLVPARLAGRLMRPIGPTLGASFVADAGLILVPALRVAEDGTRLGRGGGSYDRALRRVPPGVPIAALLHDGELVPSLPVDDWDVPVSAVATPGGGWTDVAP